VENSDLFFHLIKIFGYDDSAHMKIEEHPVLLFVILLSSFFDIVAHFFKTFCEYFWMINNFLLLFT